VPIVIALFSRAVPRDHMLRTARISRNVCLLAGAILLAPPAAAAQPDQFAQSIRPVKLRVNFLKAATARDVEANRGLRRDVATQKLTGDDRLRVALRINSEALCGAANPTCSRLSAGSWRAHFGCLKELSK
jgi:hypothetical protein